MTKLEESETVSPGEKWDHGIGKKVKRTVSIKTESARQVTADYADEISSMWSHAHDDTVQTTIVWDLRSKKSPRTLKIYVLVFISRAGEENVCHTGTYPRIWATGVVFSQKLPAT